MKDLKISELNDIYGSLLTEKKREVLKNYYDFDLSLAEIAENEGVSRQAVHDTIARAVEQLKGYEAELGIMSRKECVEAHVAAALDALRAGNVALAESELVAVLGEIREQ